MPDKSRPRKHKPHIYFKDQLWRVDAPQGFVSSRMYMKTNLARQAARRANRALAWKSLDERMKTSFIFVEP